MKAKKPFLILLITAALLSLSACNKEKASRSAYDGGYYDVEMEEAAYEADVAYAMDSYSASNSYSAKAVPASAEAESTEGTRRMIKKTASITIQVMDPNAVMDEIILLTDSLGGFVVSNSTGSEYYSAGVSLPYCDMTIRVPSDSLNAALTAIEDFTTDKSKYVTKKTISGTDITSDYVDNQSRLASLEATLTKLYEILDTAQNAEEALEVYNTIADIEMQIEVLKGNAKYMEEVTAFSSITIRINSVRPDPIVTAQKWEPLETIKDAFEGLIGLGKNVVEFMIYFIIVGIPLIAVIALPIWGIVKLIKKLAKNRKAKKNQKETTVETGKDSE